MYVFFYTFLIISSHFFSFVNLLLCCCFFFFFFFFVFFFVLRNFLYCIASRHSIKSILLQIYTYCFETLQLVATWSENVHVVFFMHVE